MESERPAVETPGAARPGRPKDVELPARRRAEILEVATEVFAERGYGPTDLQVVADRLGVGKGTVYRYFASKEALFLAAVDHGMRRLKQAVDDAVAPVQAPLDQIATGVRTYLGFFDAHPEIVELLIQERAYFRNRQQPTYFVHREANIGRWQEVLRGLIRAGAMRDVPVERTTDVISDLLYGTMFTNYFAGRKTSLVDQCDVILDILFRGLLTDKEAPTP